VNVPFKTFTWGALIGLQQSTFVLVSAGRTLGRLQTYSDLYGPRTLLAMAACATMALLLVLLMRLKTGDLAATALTDNLSTCTLARCMAAVGANLGI
jgi:membrane protein DedA with SNARE-associated domain